MASMKACGRYKIADCFAPSEEITYTALAEACGLDERPLRHLLRHAMLLRLFKEPRKGVVAHTAASAMLRDPQMYSWLTNGTELLWPSSVRVSPNIHIVFNGELIKSSSLTPSASGQSPRSLIIPFVFHRCFCQKLKGLIDKGIQHRA